MSSTGVNVVSGIATDSPRCTCCDKTLSKNECFFHCHNCGNISLCLGCVLEGKSFTRCDFRSCVVGEQDLRPTFVHGVSDTEYRDMISRAYKDPSFQFPAKAKNFLSRCTPPDGITTERLCSESSYQHSEIHEAVTTRRMENDYSLYDTLDREKKEIRLAWLLQAPEDASIAVVLIRFPYPWTQVSWNALSYCWGSLNETRGIHLAHLSNYLHDGNEPQVRNQLFTCTANLEMALRGIRQEDKNVLLWIDALCINQADHEERSYQVSVMAEIYAQANSVCVWLGYSLEQTMASGLIRTLSQAAKAGRESGQYPPAASAWQIAEQLLDSCSIMKGDEPLDRLEVIRIISTFFTNPWFRRVWVLQEVWNAKSDVLVFCGRNQPVLWQEVIFADTYLTNAYARHLHAKASGLAEPWKSFERCVDAAGDDASFQRIDILDLFTTVCQNFDASDPRDKLFGLLTMGKETYDIANLDALMVPNYSKPVDQVFVDFTKWCIRQTWSLDALGYATYTSRTLGSASSVAKIPSWTLSHCPKFTSFGEPICRISEHKVAAGTAVDLELMSMHPNPSLLTLKGYHLDVLKKAEFLYFSTRWDKDNELWLRNDEASDGKGVHLPGAMKFIWSGFVSPKTGKPLSECEPSECPYTANDDVANRGSWCTCQQFVDDMLMVMTLGGRKEHGDCEHSIGIHRTCWLKPSEIYADFAAHWVKPAVQYKSMTVTMTRKNSPDSTLKQVRLLADPDMTLFCPHVREILLPLASKGDADKFSMMLLQCNRKVFAELQTGRMGLCPLGAQEGDVVVALFGGKAPFVLRSRSGVGENDQEQVWEFIGECYFPDFMDGKHVSRLMESGQPSDIFVLC